MTNDLRAEFLLDPDIIYLNHGGFGACPRPVFDAYQQWQLELERQPTYYFMKHAPDALREARQPLGDYLHTNPDNLLFVTNATFGINQIANSLTLVPGDEILTSTHEYGAMEFTWEAFCQRTGARFVRQDIPLPFTDIDAVVDAFWQGVTPRTRIIFLSHITSATALTFPLKPICDRARAAGILTVIDGAHAPGQIPVDLDALGADFYVGNCHKWMCAPKGAGFLYARPEHQPTIKPLVISWDMDGEVDFIKRNQYTGTRDLAPFLAVPAAIAFMAQHDWPSVQQRCHAQARQMRQQLIASLGATPLSNDSTDWYMQLFAVLLPDAHADAHALQAAIYEAHRLQVVFTTFQEHTGLRISVQGYNTDADLAVALDILQKALG